MTIHYLALNVYQYSYVKSLYAVLGGNFIVHKPRSAIHLMQNLHSYPSQAPSRNWYGLRPRLEHLPYHDFTSISGVLISTIQSHFTYHKERLTTINVGHGTGHKPDRNRDKTQYDYYLVDGPMRHNKLRQINGLKIREEQIVKTGNMRFDQVINGQFDRQKILNDFGIRDQSLPNIVFAPTWKWGGGTLLKYSERLITQLSRDYNLLIRPHYYDWRQIGAIRKFIRRGQYTNVYLVEPWNIRTKDTMENLAIADLLMSDNSSIAYQSLIYNIPIILIEPESDNLREFPDEFNLRKVVDHWDTKAAVKPLVDQNLQKNKYAGELKDFLNNCFYFNDGRSTERAVSFINKLETGQG